MSAAGMIVVGGSQRSRAIEDLMTYRGGMLNNIELLVIQPEPVLALPMTEEEEEGLLALLEMRRASISPEEAADAVEAIFEEQQTGSFFAEEMRSMERFASPPRSSCGHLPSLAKCEQECEIKEIASNNVVPLKRDQPLTTLFSRRSRRL